MCIISYYVAHQLQYVLKVHTYIYILLLYVFMHCMIYRMAVLYIGITEVYTSSQKNIDNKPAKQYLHGALAVLVRYCITKPNSTFSTC